MNIFGLLLLIKILLIAINYRCKKILFSSQGADWHTFWNKMNPIMIQLKMVKQYIHPEKTITKELMHRYYFDFIYLLLFLTNFIIFIHL